jgi:hypothetical protein
MNTGFIALLENDGYSPAKHLISAMMNYFDDTDGNFVEQFQTTAFDARTWELYLFAALTELGYAFDREKSAPDFSCHGLAGSFFVEATSVNPTIRDGQNLEIEPPVEDAERVRSYLEQYMPMKFGSPLYSKLQNRYWDLPHVSGKPIVFAIQDFHLPGSMSWTESALVPYLYGRRYTALHDNAGDLQISAQIVHEHRWDGKVIPSGFFALPDAQNVSAVLTNPQGTLSKFNRMGFVAGFGSRSIKIVRFGTHYVRDPNASRPRGFVRDVTDGSYSETWVEGMNVYHNPRAIRPLSPDLLLGAAHHFLEANGQVRSLVPQFHPYGTKTVIFKSA